MPEDTEDEEKMVENEDKEIEKVEKGDESEDVLICPKCKRPVTEGDYDMDRLSQIGTTLMATKINCPQCGYRGMPIELSMKDYKELIQKKD